MLKSIKSINWLNYDTRLCSSEFGQDKIRISIMERIAENTKKLWKTQNNYDGWFEIQCILVISHFLFYWPIQVLKLLMSLIHEIKFISCVTVVSEALQKINIIPTEAECIQISRDTSLDGQYYWECWSLPIVVISLAKHCWCL